MIKTIRSIHEVLNFVQSFAGDRVFSDPHLGNAEQFRNNLEAAIADPGSFSVIGVYTGDVLTGLFSFLVLRKERYLEMLAGLSREKEAYEEMLAYLKASFPAFQGDFVYNPKNHLMGGLLHAQNAEFEPEQLKFTLETPVFSHTGQTVVPYSEAYRAGYLGIHEDEDRYWTAPKVLQAADRFHVFLALDGDHVVGYIDVTYCFEENEPYDLFVCPAYRRRGYGRALLERAVESNLPKEMMLLVDHDNLPARRLYASMGFVLEEAGGNITAHLKL